MSDTNDLLLAHRVLPDENGRSIGRLRDRIDTSSEDLSITQTAVMKYTNVVFKHDRNQTSSLSRNLVIKHYSQKEYIIIVKNNRIGLVELSLEVIRHLDTKFNKRSISLPLVILNTYP